MGTVFSLTGTLLVGSPVLEARSGRTGIRANLCFVVPAPNSADKLEEGFGGALR